jgi:hypothetical protein
MSAPARILIASVTDWPFPARLAGAFTGLGAKVEAVCLRRSPLHRSGLAIRLHPFCAFKPLPALGAAIARAAPDLVIPCDDLMAELLWRLAEARPQFKPLIARSCGNLEAFPVLAARNDFLREAAKAGAPSAATIALESEADLSRAIAAFGLPLVLKADASWGGDGVVIAQDAAAAKAALARFSPAPRWKLAARALKRGEPHLLVRARFAVPPAPGAQRFVAGHPATSSIACWRGRLLAANHFDVRVSSGGAGGTGPATVLGLSRDPAMQDSARRIAARFGLSGLYGLDYMRGADGSIALLEINPRATPTAHLALGPDHDLIAALLTAAGHPVPDRPALTRQDTIALFPQEWRRDPQSPHLAAAYHDLPEADPALAAALGWRKTPLTSFSQGFPGLSGLDEAAGQPGR